MKKTFLFLAVMVVGVFMVAQSAFAWLIVGDYGDSGWQTFSHTFTEGDGGAWTGNIGFLVSDFGNTDLSSVLLVDNLNIGSNPGFETGVLTGYTASGDISVVMSAMASNGTVYLPTQGSYMAMLTVADIDTSAFGGTDGAILWLNGVYSFNVGNTVSFDWAFLAMDYVPFEDFSLLLHQTQNVIEGFDEIEYDELGKIGVIPEPASMSLLGLGLLSGLARLRRKRA